VNSDLNYSGGKLCLGGGQGIGLFPSKLRNILAELLLDYKNGSEFTWAVGKGN